jgi:predicted ATPase/DNA-binding CsgD family transcriptional regulator
MIELRQSTAPTIGAASVAVPAGTVAFLLTDVAGSTVLWEAEPDAMALAMGRHQQLLDEVIRAHHGIRPEEQGEGDSMVAAFTRASDAVLAAIDAQLALAAEPWPTTRPLRVRMAVHTGEARLLGDANYAGTAIIRAARIRAIGHGGQVLVSQAARDLALDQLGDVVDFADLGLHRLKDLARPERIWQLEIPGLDGSFRPLASVDAVTHNLPTVLSTFVGRREETATILRLLEDHRLVTLTGSGGSGKTRLALQVAAELIDRFSDGVWWVDLASVHQPEGVAVAVSAALDGPDDASSDPLPRLVRRLAARSALLVLDNAEHLVAEVARVAHALASGCEHLRVLVTSRAPLEVPGEVSWRVPSLGVPPRRDQCTPVDSLSQYDAVRLFVDRAQHVRPGFALNDANGPEVAEICHRLDGIPLAIELAAARCRSLSPDQVLHGLGDALHMLTGTTRTVLPRQQTLAASIAWSHDLLTEPQRVVLRRLSVFVGGWTLPAAEYVTADGELVDGLQVLDLLDGLVQQSLIQLDDGPAGAVRYRMLETVRQFAAHRLDAVHETADTRARHAEWALQFLGDLGEWARDDRVFAIWTVLQPEVANIDSGARWLHRAGDVTGLVGALNALRLWFLYSCRYPMALRWLGPALTERAMLSVESRFDLLATASLYLWAVGRIADAAAAIGEAQRLAQVLGDEVALARVKVIIAAVGVSRATPGAEEGALQALAVARATGDSELEWSAVLTIVGLVSVTGRPLESAPWLAELRVLTSARPPAMLTHLLWYEGTQARMEGRIRESLERYDELERLWQRGGVLPQTIARAGNALTNFAAGLADPDEDRLDLLLDDAQADGDLQGVTLFHVRFGLRALRTGDLVAARNALNRARAAMPDTLWALWADAGLVHVADALGDHDAAEAAIARLRASGHPLRLVQADAAEASILTCGDPSRAKATAHRALATAVEYGLTGEVAPLLEVLACAEFELGNLTDAARLIAAGHRLRDERGLHGCPRPLCDRRAAVEEGLRNGLTEQESDRARAEGAAMDWTTAVAYVQRTRGRRQRPSSGWAALTPTEHRVIESVTSGLTNPEIARQLLMGTETVKSHLASIYTKLDVRNRAQLTAAALQH